MDNNISTVIEKNLVTLASIRKEHKEGLMKRFDRKFTTNREKLDGKEMLDPTLNRSVARKLFFREKDFIKYVINKGGKYTVAALDETIKKFSVKKVVKTKEVTCIFLCNKDVSKSFDRGLYCVALEKDKLSFNVVNIKENSFKMLDKINVPVILKPSPVMKKLTKAKVKKLAKKVAKRLSEEGV